MRMLSNDSVLGRVARLPLRLVPREKPVPVLAGALRGLRWIPGAATHGCWLGWFERVEQQRFESIVSPGTVIYDVGACVGFYTLLASRLTGESGRVVAFEPLPRNLGYLRKHLQLNGQTNTRVIAAAVSNHSGTARLFVSDSPTQNQLRVEGPGLDVPVVTIDDVARTERTPNLIKIDVEGAEAQVLSGARLTLATARPHVLLSTHDAGAREQSLDLLCQLGYACVPMDPRDPPQLTMEWYASPLPS